MWRYYYLLCLCGLCNPQIINLFISEEKSVKTKILARYYNEYFDIIGAETILSEDKLTITKPGSASQNWNNASYSKVIIPSTSKKIIT